MEKVSAYTDRATESGEWRSGNPASGQQATPMLAAYFNMLQRELLGVLEAAGIQPNVNDDNQLAKSVLGMLRSAAAKATEVLRGVLRVGTQEEVNAGTLDDVAVTPKKLRMGFAISISYLGYVVFPSWMGGWIIQWGEIGVSASDIITPLPIAFPNEFGRVIVCNSYTQGSGSIGYIAAAPASKSSIVSRGSSASLGASYIAIGK